MLFKTVKQSTKFFYGKSGITWQLLLYGVRYLSPWFHPWNQNNRDKLQVWLSANDLRLQKVHDNKSPLHLCHID